MNEKQAIADTLSSLNAFNNMLTYSVVQSNNKNLRDTFTTFRNQVEDLQWEIYLIAKENGYYVPAAPAGQADIDAVKQVVTSE
ncbi:MAG: spore coat protein [Clostridia bacterium]|nr:spore coat protein [Clostridia bacterium]